MEENVEGAFLANDKGKNKALKVLGKRSFHPTHIANNILI
jgi:hypothetical protein